VGDAGAGAGGGAGLSAPGGPVSDYEGIWELRRHAVDRALSGGAGSILYAAADGRGRRKRGNSAAVLRLRREGDGHRRVFHRDGNGPAQADRMAQPEEDLGGFRRRNHRCDRVRDRRWLWPIRLRHAALAGRDSGAFHAAGFRSADGRSVGAGRLMRVTTET